MIEQFDILTLSNKKKYTVAEQLTYNEKNYLLLVEVNDNEELLNDHLVVEKVKTAKGYGIKKIKDKDILKYVSNKLVEMLNNEK